MSQPERVDSEITFKSNPGSSAHSNTQMDQDRQDSISECGSMYEGQSDEAIRPNTCRPNVVQGELHKQITDMASLMSDMMQELKTLKSRGSVDPDQTTRCSKGITEHGSEPSHLEPSNVQGPLPVCNARVLEYQEAPTQISQQARRSDSRHGSQRIPISYESHYICLDLNRGDYNVGLDRNCRNVGSAHDFQRPVRFDDRNFRVNNQSYQIRPCPAPYHSSIWSPLAKLQPFNGNNNWSTWIAQFEAIARRQGLSQDEMLDQLLPRLEGQAAEFVFTQLPPAVLDSYGLLREEMESRFQTIETSRSFASRFYRRSHRHNETLEEYAADLKRLYDRAHGYRSKQTRDEDLVRRFMDGLEDKDLKFAIEFNKEPSNIDEALYYAVNYMQIKGVPKHGKRGRFTNHRGTHDDDRIWSEQDPDHIRSIRDGQDVQPDSHEERSLLLELLDRVSKLEQKSQEKKSRSDRECYNCHKVGHLARNCPDKRNDQDERCQEADTALNFNRPYLVAKERSQ